MKLTVSEYAKELNVSVQTIYKKIKTGVITTIKENGITYVIVDSSEVKQAVKPSSKDACKPFQKIIKRNARQIKDLQKEIKRLTKELSRAKDGKAEVLEKFIFEVKRLQAPKEEIIEIKPKKKDKKKRKKGKK